MGDKRIAVSGGFCLFLAGMLLCVPVSWIAAAALAAAVHELGHFLAIRLLTGKEAKPAFFAFSARMPLPEMGRGAELICALAGPAAGLCLLLAVRWLPRTAVCALAQSVFNLLPIWPLDGGRAIRCVADMVLPPPKAERICRYAANVFRGITVAAAIFVAFRLNLGILPLMVAGIVVFPRK